MLKEASFIWLGLLLVASSITQAVNIWPLPAYVSHGSERLYLSKNFGMQLVGPSYTDHSGILENAFSRFLHVVQMDHVADSSLTVAEQTLSRLHILVSSRNDELQYGIDESYNLSIPVSKSSSFARLEAQTVYGVLHGLQTFSQLCQFNYATRMIEVRMAPWSILDRPRFSYRGLLIDTSRHFLPVPVIKAIIDAMSYTKLNVLHWHMVDTQSFPMEIPSYPKLWKGAYSPSERYTMADADDVVRYAQRQGINVLPEIDVPGHALSWGNGYPSLWPSSDCKEPLDVSKDFTFEVLSGILSDFSKVFKFKFAHLGGDEVNTSCWINTPHVRRWLNKKGLNASQAYAYFVLRAQEIAISHGYEVVNWEETFNNFPSKLSRKTVVHNWLGSGVAQRVVASGLRCIVSNQDSWYLDHLDTTWEEFYMNEPLANITDAQHNLVIGGEICMWGEHVDASDIQQTIWPRGAAAAERLWTPYNKLAKRGKEVVRRLAHFRCLLNQRGIAAAPLRGPGRAIPENPDSCYLQ